MDNDRSKPEDLDATQGDELDDAVIAADDTGMLSGERLITLAELQEGGSSAGEV